MTRHDEHTPITTVCGHCRRPTRSIGSGAFRCPDCDRRYDVREEPKDTLPGDVPPGLTVRDEDAGPSIRRRWAWPAGVLAGILGGALLLLAAVFTLHTSPTGSTVLNALILGPLYLLAAVPLYVGAGFLLNTTRIDVQNGTLTVRHGPVPWPGAVDLVLSDVQGFRCERRVTKTVSGKRKHGQQTNVRYRVRARLEDGTDRVVVDGLPEFAPARHIQRTLSEGKENV